MAAVICPECQTYIDKEECINYQSIEVDLCHLQCIAGWAGTGGEKLQEVFEEIILNSSEDNEKTYQRSLILVPLLDLKERDDLDYETDVRSQG